MRVLTHHIPANAGNMQELYKRKKAVIQTLCLLALFGMYHLPAFPKNNDASLPIDTLIIRIPSVMRSDETAARHMIAALEKKSLQAQLNRGIAMPLLVGFIGSQARHFILVLHYTQTNGSYRYLVYDPWEGRCAYVDEYAIRNNSFNPLLAQWNIRVGYYFPAA